MEWEIILESSRVVWWSIRVVGRILGRHSGVVWGHWEDDGEIMGGVECRLSAGWSGLSRDEVLVKD